MITRPSREPRAMQVPFVARESKLDGLYVNGIQQRRCFGSIRDLQSSPTQPQLNLQLNPNSTPTQPQFDQSWGTSWGSMFERIFYS